MEPRHAPFRATPGGGWPGPARAAAGRAGLDLPWNEVAPLPRSAALLGLAVLPIGVVARLRWLSAASLLWGALFLVVELPGWNGGVMRAAGGAALSTAVVIASLAAAGSQAWNLGALALGPVGRVLRALPLPAIALCVLLLLTFLSGVGGLQGALAMLFTALADLALTLLILLAAALAAWRRGRPGSSALRP